MTERFNISTEELTTLKKAARYMKLEWRPLAARPDLARRILDLVAERGVEEGCEEYARQREVEFNVLAVYGGWDGV